MLQRANTMNQLGSVSQQGSPGNGPLPVPANSTAGSASTGGHRSDEPNAHVSSGTGADGSTLSGDLPDNVDNILNLDQNLQPGIQAPDHLRGPPTADRVWSDLQADRDRWPTIFDRFPGYASGADILKLLYHVYPIATGVRLRMLSNDKKTWLLSRSEHNRSRGDRSSIDDKKTSLKSIGVLDIGSGGGPWALPLDSNQSHGDTAEQRFGLLHWATRNDALYELWTEDPEGTQYPEVAKAIEAGFNNCTIWNHKTPHIVKEYLVECGNLTNHVQTSTTLIEIYQCIPTCKSGWEKAKRKYGWSHATLGQSGMDGKEFQYVKALFTNPQRFYSFRHYEEVSALYYQSNSLKPGYNSPAHMALGQGPSESWWSDIQATLKEFMDFKHQHASNFMVLAKGIYLTFRKLKHEPAFFDMVLQLIIPFRTSKDLAQPGQGALCRQGLGNPAIQRISEAHFDNLFSAIGEQKNLKKQLGKEADAAALAAKTKHEKEVKAAIRKRDAAAKALAKKKGISVEEAKKQVPVDSVSAASRVSPAHVASGPGAEDAEAPVVLEYSTTDTVLDLIKKHSAYMRTLVLRAGPMSVAMEKTLRAFEFQCLYGALNGPPLPLLPLVNH